MLYIGKSLCHQFIANKEEKIILKNNLKQKIKIENRIEVISLKIIF